MARVRSNTPLASNALRSAAAKAGLTADTLNAVQCWLAEQLIAHEYAKLGQGGHTQNQVPLRRVFVDLPVTDSPNADARKSERVHFLEKLLKSTPVQLRDACIPPTRISVDAPEIDDDNPKSKVAKQKVWDRRTQPSGYAATLLIGGPGQGKSTLGQLACQLHRAALLKPFEDKLTSAQRELVRSFEPVSSGTKGKLNKKSLCIPKNPLLPIQIALPDLAAWLVKDEAQSSEDELEQSPALLRFVADLPSAKECGLTAFDLLRLASQMPSLIVLDGFDEVGATEDRERLVSAAYELLSTLGHRGASAQVVATTRPQGYAGELAQIGVLLRERYLSPLLRDEAMEYATKLVEAKIPGADMQRKALSRLHEAAGEPATERLLTSPLQVTILTALVQQLGRAPRERWNLFSRYFSYTYDREIERGTYASRLLAEHRAHIEQIHARVALLLQVEAERDGGASARMSRARLEEVIEAVLAEDEVSDRERKDLVHDIAVAAEQRLVFLVEPEPGSFGFEIRSLQEFMAAWALTSGRDVEIEARLHELARAPMFRNVLLFVASRLFSEGSPLRDILAEKICSSVDEDLNDNLARLTCAGALLALEMLEEGAALSQPKRARALMERAVRLLTLPPGTEHTRLARSANSDTEFVLRDAIEQSIGGLRGERKYNRESGWVCLIEAANRGHEWAVNLGNAYWENLPEGQKLLKSCETLRISLGPWIRGKIEESAARFCPEDFINLPISPFDSKSIDWISWLAGVLGNENAWRERGDLSHLYSLVRRSARKLAEPRTVPPTSWAVWIAIARFEVTPTALHLETALDAISSEMSVSQWGQLTWATSWPLGTCLRAATLPEELRSIEKLVRSGELGDIEEWLRAEHGWKEPKNALSLLDNLHDRGLWTKTTLINQPPLLAMPTWSLVRFGGDETSSRTTVITKANKIQKESTSRGVKQWLAEACLYFIRGIPAKAMKSEWDVKRWTSDVQEGITYLVPRPKCIDRTKWSKLLDQSPLPAAWRWFMPHELVFESLLENTVHPVVLRVAVLTLPIQPSHMWIKQPQVDQVAANLRDYKPKSATERVDLGILRIFLGMEPGQDDEEFLADVVSISNENPLIWQAFLNAFKPRRLSSLKAEALLGRAFMLLGTSHHLSSATVPRLRSVLQTRKSGLDGQATWNRLALPLPYPRPPLRPRFDGTIPLHPITLQQVELKDICGLHNLRLTPTLPSDNRGQWIFIIGTNGIGKTTLLRSLALALRNAKDPAIWPKGTFANSWQRAPNGEDDRAIDSHIIVTLGDSSEYKTLIRSNHSLSVVQIPEHTRPRLFPLFAYGCRRGSALGGAARQVDLSDDDGPEIATLFDEGASLIHAETWLLQLEGDAPKSARSKAIYEVVIDAIKTLLDVEKIEVLDKKVWVTERGQPRLPFNALSDGYLTSAGWFLDLLARWIALVERQNEKVESNFMQHIRGLVLVDEIDLHLHPKWQLDFVTRTRKLLPQMSFVVTTHNPLTLVGAKAEEIWILSNNKGRVIASSGADNPMLLTGGQIYRSYFGIEDIYPNELGRALQRYSFLSGYALRSDAEQDELEQLKSQLSEAGFDPGWEVVPRSEPKVSPKQSVVSKKSPEKRGGGSK